MKPDVARSSPIKFSREHSVALRSRLLLDANEEKGEEEEEEKEEEDGEKVAATGETGAETVWPGSSFTRTGAEGEGAFMRAYKRKSDSKGTAAA